MSENLTAPKLAFPFARPPGPGEALQVAPGILWVRLALPFRLDHVNVYLIDDEGGWAVLDTGLGDLPTRAAWEALLAGPLAGRPLTRLVITHYHPDHVGSAGWLVERFGLRLYMTATEYLVSLNLHLDPGALEAEPFRRFYLEHGLDPGTTEQVVTRGHQYLKMATGLPPSIRRLVAGDKLRIGRREFEVLTGGGHAPEQVMLLAHAEGIFFSSDQVLAKISPNVSVSAIDPEGDPLGLYLRSLDALRSAVPGDVLVLPGHNLPFRGLHDRVTELEEHHELRCAEILKACRDEPKSAAELVPVLFHRPLDPHQMGFAFSEVLAHVNHMWRQGRLKLIEQPDGIVRSVAC